MEKTSFLKKAPLRTLRVLEPIKTSPFVVPTTIRKEAPTGNAPMGAISLKAATNRFPQVGGNQTQEASGVVFDPTQGDEGVATLPPNDSFQASLSPPVGGRLHSFRRDWLTNKCSNNVLNIITNGYILPFISKPNLVSPSKRISSDLLYPVSSVKEHNRKGRKCKISRVLQSPASCTQASPKVEASNRPKQAQHLPTCPIHPNSRKYLRFFHSSQMFQFTSLRTSHAPSGLYNGCKEVKLMALSRGIRLHEYLDDGLIRAQSQEEVQINTQTVLDLTHSLGWIINQEKSELKPTQVFSFMGYKYVPSRFSSCKTLSRERAQTSGFDILRLKSKHVLTARFLMSLTGLLALTEKMVLEGRLHMRPFQFHLKEHWRFPQSLDTLLPWTETISAHLEWWQNPTNMIRGADLHPKNHSLQLFTDTSNEGWGAHLEQTFAKGLWSDRGKRLHINVLERKAVALALQRFKDQCQNQTVLVATNNSTVVAHINKQGGTHLCTLLWKIMP